LKDAVRLGAYFAAVLLLGALLAPILFWSAQLLSRNSGLSFLAQFDFETFFHRALLVSAAVLLWPLLRISGIRRLADLGLRPNRHPWSDYFVGFLAALVPLMACGAVLIALGTYSLRSPVSLGSLAKTVISALTVPVIEEAFFRGLVLGILLRAGRPYVAMFLTSALFSVVHFLKAPEGTSPSVTWSAGFQSMSHAFAQFNQPLLVLAGFTTLFLIGWVLADARMRTASLWLPMGLHAGWILGNGVFSRFARREFLLLPWLGRNLLIGLIPLAVVGLTWIIVWYWCKREPVD